MCTVLLPPGDNPIAVNKYINIISEIDYILRQPNSPHRNGTWSNRSCGTIHIKDQELFRFRLRSAFADSCRGFGQTCCLHVQNITIFSPVPNLKRSCPPRGELSYLAPLGSENISASYFKQCFFQGGGVLPPRQSNTTPPSPKTEITNILFYILNFASMITFKM